MPRHRRYAKKAPAYKRKAALRKSVALRRAGGRKKYGMKVMRYNTMAGLLTNSLWKYSARRLPYRIKAMKAVGAPDIYHQNFGEAISCIPGSQKFRFYATCRQAQLKSILDSTPSGAPNRVCLESAQSELTFTNIMNAAVEVELYDIFLKRDVPTLSQFTTTSGTYSWLTIEGAIKVGAQAASGIAPAGSDPTEAIGATPFDSPVFKDYCRVVRKSHVMLASGASHRHQSLIGLNKLITRTAAGNEDLTLLKGVSYGTLLVVRGVGGYAPEAGTGTTNNAILSVITSVRIKYTFVTDNTNTIHYNNQLDDEVPNVRNIGSGAYELVNP